LILDDLAAQFRRTWRQSDHRQGHWSARSLTLGCAACATFLATIVTGCNQGVAWQGPTYTDAREVAQRSGQPIFVYFRNWYSVDCTRFEENVLKDPAVLAETRTMVCVPLDFDWDRPLAQQWRLTATPAFVIVTADGRVLARGQNPLTREDLLAAFRQARSALTVAPSTQSTSADQR